MSATTNQAAATGRRLCPFCRRPLIYCTCDRGRDAIRAARPGIQRMLDDLRKQRRRMRRRNAYPMTAELQERIYHKVEREWGA